MMINPNRYTHKAKYRGIPVWYDQYQEGDDWIRGTNEFYHFFVVWLLLIDFLMNKPLEVYDAEEL